MSDFIGYPSMTDCEVCNEWDENMIEPRYGYVVCKKHYDTPPVEVSAIVRARREAHQ